jgi:hypothetical protein
MYHLESAIRTLVAVSIRYASLRVPIGKKELGFSSHGRNQIQAARAAEAGSCLS